MIESEEINGLQIYPFKSSYELMDFIEDKKTILIAVNAEKIISKQQDIKKIINKNIGYPDGYGAVLALKSKGIHSRKIAGCELWLEIIEKNLNKNFYFIGSTDEVLNKCIQKLKKNYAGIRIAGYRNGFLESEGEEELKNQLLKHKPDFVFVAMGSPRQELLMENLIKIFPTMYMGLGGSFDVYSGSTKRAPKLFIRLNLEFLWRRLAQPFKFNRIWALIIFGYNLLMRRL
ncbi:WecB/TagA/CpsF family glycosyltransferase [Gammaproteobacteria bacterium]|nr:WecB/TagA/CpsF family glycosyltransferase [Gammaproteobacteria bacterium]